MNQKVKRAIAAAMSLTMVATATPVSPLYNAIQNAVSSVMMQANASENKYIENYDSDTFNIATLDDLNLFAEAVNSGNDFSGKIVFLDADIEGFQTPIGTYKHRFMGTFDGQGHNIKLDMNMPDVDFVGLFGCVDGATIGNITVTGHVYCAGAAGGICGYADSANVYNCTNIAEVTGGSTAGGICGLTDCGFLVYNCTNNAAVNATNAAYGYAGGILGYADESTYPSVYNCANIATVTGEKGAGGICGYSFFPLVHNCINIAAVIPAVPGQTTDIVGICGCSSEPPYFEGTDIDNCYLLDVNNKFDEEDGVTEITDEQLKGTKTVKETNQTLIELLNDYVKEFNSKPENAGIVLLEWEQGQGYPILKIPVPQDAYTKIDGTNLKWAIDEGTLKIKLDDTNKTSEQYANDNAIPDWTDLVNNAAPWRNDVYSIKSIEIADGVTRIGNFAFYNCNNLTTITIPASVKSIGEGAYRYDWKVQSVEFKGAMPEIGDQAFYDVGTAALIFPENDESWKNFFADNADSIRQNILYWKGGQFKTFVYNKIEGTNLMWSLDNGRFTVDLFDKTITDETLNAMPDYSTASPWYDYKASIKTLDIANGVTKIGESTFDTCANLESVTIPATVKNIGKSAFGWCNDLKSVVFTGNTPSVDTSQYFWSFNNVGTQDNPAILYYPKGNDSWGKFLNGNTGTLDWANGKFTPVAYEVIKDAEGQDTNLMWYLEDEGTDGKKLTIGLINPNETDTTKNAMPDWEQYIDRPWENIRTSITSVEICDGVTKIGYNAFYWCSGLTSVTIPNGVTSISDNAFRDCSALTEVTIPNSVTSIGNYAFYQCSGLKSVTIPGFVTNIGAKAFYACTSLESITFEGNVPTDVNNDAFSDVGTKNKPVTLYYPKDNTSWNGIEDEVDGKQWYGGYFKAEAYLNWKNIDGTALRWALSANGTLYIDKQENAEAGGNFEVPAYDDDAPWNDSIDKIRFVNISSSVTGVKETSFSDFNGIVLILEEGSTLKPTAVINSTYDTLGGGQFIYSKSQLTGASLSLAGKIGVNLSFYITEENPTIIINDTTIELTDPNLTIKNNVYTYTLEVAPKDAYDDITFEVKKDSETIITEGSYNVKSQYVDVVLADTEHKKYNKKVFDMVTALDTYINSSRVYFGIETDSDKITEINSAIDKITVVIPSKIETPVYNETMYYGSSLILDSGVKVRHYIKIADGTDISKFKLAVNGNDITDAKLTKSGIKSGSDDVYFFETDEFNPFGFDKKVSVTYDGTTVIDKYSVLTFIKLALDNPTTAAKELGATCKAISNFYNTVID